MPKTAPQTVETPQDAGFSYDDVPYESYSYSHTHPQNLHMIGTLFGMKPADFKTARVLELGCAAGGNILPLACLYPEARFTGIDLSKTQIDEASKDAKALHLKNITFEQMDINDFPAKAGAFDYIICHGILSWVPAGVQDAIFDVFQRHLAPQGLAIVSYNCLPGWSAVRALREMMMFHTQRFESARDKITQARAFLDFVHDNTPASNAAYKQIIDTERQTLKKTNDSYLFHDHLEQNNTPFYLHEVIGKATAKDLQYVGDTSVATMFIGNLPKEASEKLGAINNIVLQEQYMDFLNNRRFRNSIFTRANVPISRNLKGERALDLTVKALFRIKGENTDILKLMEFERSDSSGAFSSNDAPASALLRTMAETYKPMPVRELIRKASGTFGLTEETLTEAASKNLLRLFFSGFVQFYAAPPACAETLPAKPKVYKYARHLAEKQGTRFITNMIGESVPVDRHGAEIIRLADGSRTHDEIAEDFEAYMKKTGDAVYDKGIEIKDVSARKAAIKTLTQKILGGLLHGYVLTEQ